MLESLNIKNYAIIDELFVEFSKGLNVITGETGAGKSIVIDALELVLGARSSVEMIRYGADFISVSAVFRLKGEKLPDDFPFELENGDLLILRREVRLDGTGRCFINDRPVTLKTLRELGNILVDLHGQHDHQSLLDKEVHYGYLDSFGKFGDLALEVESLYEQNIILRRKLNDLELETRRLTRDYDFSQFQIKEIESLEIKPDEDIQLENDIRKLSNAVELKSLGWDAFQNLEENENSVLERIGEIALRVSNLAKEDSVLNTYSEKIEEISILVSELADSFRKYSESIEDDPAVIVSLEERYGHIEKIKKKYGPSLQEVFHTLEKLKKETLSVEEFEERIKDLKNELYDIETVLLEKARLLSEKRIKSAPVLSKEAESHLSGLGMGNAKLVIDISKCDGDDKIVRDGKIFFVGKSGMDSVEFLISANPGEPPKPLVKVASGGEISRVMLSLKLALADVDGVPTMVFDEIDIGVSGKVADSIGKKMLQLSKYRQVLTITHLPQIAAMADRHFSARKSVVGNKTFTELILLGDGDRQREIASLLSGEELSETALAHAKRLMENTTKDN